MKEWESFFLAQAGASAALTGLVFVSVSINISQILAAPVLASRALEALLFLGTILVLSSLVLVPGQPTVLLAAEISLVALLLWAVVLRLDLSIRRQIEPQFRGNATVVMALNQTALVLYLLGGLSLLVVGEVGLYWLVPAMLLSYFKALADAWVLLVEINR